VRGKGKGVEEETEECSVKRGKEGGGRRRGDG
jgi:hypothetical protein